MSNMSNVYTIDKLPPPPQRTSLQVRQDQSSASKGQDGHKFSGQETTEKGMQSMGDMGDVSGNGKKHDYEKQKAAGGSSQWMGNKSEGVSHELIKAFGRTSNDTSS
ncbi:hypothetical protein LQW54_010793 [Pestalotiopsis sp. IQ-011]